VDKQIGAQRDLADKKADETGTKGTGEAKETPKAETSEGGVSVAAAVGVNIATSTARAFIPDNGRVSSGGLLTLSSSNKTDATAKADGSAVSAEDANGAASVNVGVGVAINVVNAVNEAYVGSGSTIDAQWLTIEAKRTEVSGETAGKIGAEAISGASGGKIGIAGSLALNIAESRNEALIKDGATVTLAGGDLKIVAEGATSSTVLATAKGAAVEQKAKVTAAGDTALITAGHADRECRGSGDGDACRRGQGRSEVYAAGRQCHHRLAARRDQGPGGPGQDQRRRRERREAGGVL
jgi:mucin-19